MLKNLILTGQLVRLEPLALGGVDELLAAASEDRSTYQFTSVPADQPAMVRYVEAALADQAAGRALPFVTRRLDTGEAVGSTRFMDLDYWALSNAKAEAQPDRPSACEIGSTWLAASAQRTGVNVDAKLLMLTYAFETWQVHRVTLKTDERNQRSRDAILRLGAQFEGVRRAHMPSVNGGVRNSAYYSIVRAEWPAVKLHLMERVARARGG
jgi:RimJ/RimL family protein N-acetyltransferase